MTIIDASVLSSLPLDAIDQVSFYKRDELTTDLICCDIMVGSEHRIFHEELTGWDLLLNHLRGLPNFHGDWYSDVSQPPFEESETIAFCRKGIGS